ncbi:MAG: cation:proton antiporter [Candidatus Riflebacteria bacterium]|nr:cation:proton antiporter [Candidatus Riflebacteria bacterium]
MAFSLASILIFSLLVDWLFRLLDLPGFVGILLVGLFLGPHYFNGISTDLLAISTDLRLIALVVILLRAGFSIHIQSIRHFGWRLLLFSILPSVVEAFTVAVGSHFFLSFSWYSAMTLGFILPAVSPAVIIPFMLRYIDEKRGTAKKIPQFIIAAASLDNIFNILVCNIFISLYGHPEAKLFLQFVKIPVAIINGIFLGLCTGFALCKIFEKFNPRATKRGLVVLALSLLFVQLEKIAVPTLVSPLLATMVMGSLILTHREKMAHEIASKLGKIWIFAEIVLFAIVGAEFNPALAWQSGIAGILIVILGVFARLIGVWFSLIASSFTTGEKGFIMSAWTPKASVQAALGAAPLLAMKAARLDCSPGEMILALSTLSIILTAPLGAIATKKAGDKWLTT